MGNVRSGIEGYVVNTSLSSSLKQEISKLQQQLDSIYPELWFPSADALHCTLFDLFAPLVDYGRPTRELFLKYKDEYESFLSKLFAEQQQIKVKFNEVRVTENAIIIVGVDDGSFMHLRNQLLSDITLVEGTKQPPQIIHSTIARSEKQLEQPNIMPGIDFEESVNEFRLVREIKTPMLDYEILNTYPL